MNIEKGIELLKNGVDISITDDGQIYRSNELDYNEGYKMIAIYWENRTKKDCREEIRRIRTELKTSFF